VTDEPNCLACVQESKGFSFFGDSLNEKAYCPRRGRYPPSPTGKSLYFVSNFCIIIIMKMINLSQKKNKK